MSFAPRPGCDSLATSEEASVVDLAPCTSTTLVTLVISTLTPKSWMHWVCRPQLAREADSEPGFVARKSGTARRISGRRVPRSVNSAMTGAAVRESALSHEVQPKPDLIRGLPPALSLNPRRGPRSYPHLAPFSCRFGSARGNPCGPGRGSRCFSR